MNTELWLITLFFNINVFHQLLFLVYIMAQKAEHADSVGDARCLITWNNDINGFESSTYNTCLLANYICLEESAVVWTLLLRHCQLEVL